VRSSIRGYKIQLGLLLVGFVVLAMGLHTGRAAALYSGTYITQNTWPGAQTDLVNSDRQCSQDLYNTAVQKGEGNTRQAVDDSHPYPYNAWISSANPNQDTVYVDYGSTAQIPLEYNAMQYICAILTNPPQSVPSIYNYYLNGSGPANILTTGNYPDDRAPATDTLHAASLQGIYTLVNYWVVGESGPTAGSLTGPAVAQKATIAKVQHDIGSRYWFASPTPFNYKPDGSITSDFDIFIGVDASLINSYGPNNNYCVSGGPTGDPNNANSFNNCGDKLLTYTIHVKLNPAPPVGNLTCSGGRLIVGGAYDPNDDTKGLQVNFFHNGNNANNKIGSANTPGGTSAVSRTSSYPAGSDLSGTFYAHILGVDSNGAADGKNINLGPVTCTGGPPPGGPTPIACPGDTNINTNSLVTVALDNMTPAPAGSNPDAPSPLTTTNGSVKFWYEYHFDGTAVRAVNDISPAGSPITPLPNMVNSQSPGQAVLDYKYFVWYYPYDYNQPSVTYDTKYTYTVWHLDDDTAAGPGHYKWVAKTVTPGVVSNTEGADNTVPNVEGSDHPYRMNPCYPRNYSVNDPVVNAALINDSEDPTTMNTKVLSSTISYSLPDVGYTQQVRSGAPLQVATPLPVNISYVYKSSGASVGCAITPTSSTSVTGPPLAAPGTIGVSPTPPETNCDLTNISVTPGAVICAVYTIYNADGQMDTNGTISNASGTATGQSCKSIDNKPYVQFFGNDVSAGGGFSNSVMATCTNGGGIATESIGVGPLARGSGSELAALSIGPASSFPSAFLRTTSPTSITGLSFSNTLGAGASGNLGGQHCIPDYYATLPSTHHGINNTTIDQLATTTSPYRSTEPTQTVVGNMTIGHGVHSALYVTNGDLYINGDITFAGGTAADPWTSTDDIPSLYIVVQRGNIYIDPSVSQLDGVFVAQPNANTGAGGIIDTCATASGSLTTAGTMFDNCGGQLTVNGAFISNKVRLTRTYASLRNSVAGEHPANQGGDCSKKGNVVGGRTDQSYSCAAEVFNFSPETYLAPTSTSPPAGPQQSTYDYITSLSPVL
jgi:hypothetical protein